ncbi:MAG: Gfo/Idh/MocA family oxidoreductase [Clostridia bacterium]|nr:Gfo/Idh/MocA family oxidoreductase [Clostridia bacterium]
MNNKLTVAVIGCGAFAKFFVPLFKAHPYVEKVYVCDLDREKALDYSKNFSVEIIDTFEDSLKDPKINCIGLFTQRHLHGPQVLAALKAGKHVYSAVPMASRVDECHDIVELVKKTGLTYMMGETCIYYPCSMFCKSLYESGELGKFVYGEAQYHHDISHFSENFRKSFAGGVPPFYYPTHSTSMILNAVGSYVKKVVAMGYEDSEMDGIFEVGKNHWDNTISNSYSLMKLANGGTARINELRRVGYKSPSSYINGFYGTKGAYQFANAQHTVTKLTQKGVDLFDVSAQVNPIEMEEHRGEADFMYNAANHVWQATSFSPQHEQRRKTLPESFNGLTNGHMGSHQLLIDDFCTAVYFDKLPTVNAWQAARYTIPGLLAHESILKDSLPIDVPDCGDAPIK